MYSSYKLKNKVKEVKYDLNGAFKAHELQYKQRNKLEI